MKQKRSSGSSPSSPSSKSSSSLSPPSFSDTSSLSSPLETKNSLHPGAFLDQLEVLAKLSEWNEENPFKARAYRKGLEILNVDPEQFQRIAEGTQSMPGVGPGLRSLMLEWIQTGRIDERERLEKALPQGFLELIEVPGLGPKKVRKLLESLGVTSEAELLYACRENRLRDVEGFGEASQKKILQALEQRERFGKWVLWSDAQRAFQSVCQRWKQCGFPGTLLPVGEWSRCPPLVSKLEIFIQGWGWDQDVSFLTQLSQEEPEGPVEPFWKWFVNSEEGWGTGALRPHFAMASAREHQTPLPLWRLQIPSDWKQDAPLLAKIAAAEKGPDSPLWFESEYRNQWCGGFSFAYEQPQLKGIFHVHTTASDGRDSLEDMVRAAEARGYEYIGISDHSASAFYARGLDEGRLLEQGRSLRALQKKARIKIFHGVESDILAEGDLDYDDRVLDTLDFVIASVHSRFQMGKEAMTARLLKAVRNPYTTFLGHPTGRLLLGRPGYEFDFEVVVQALRDRGGVLELNANPQRLDVDWHQLFQFGERRPLISVNPDAHDLAGLDDTEYGLIMAKKARVPGEMILNTWPVSRVESWLLQRRSSV